MEVSEKTALLSILTNLSLVGIKTLLAVLSGSLAIKADAIHSLSDVISSGVILLGIKTSKRRISSFPYGLYKVENLVALGTSFLIFLAAYEIVKEIFLGTSRLLPENIPLAACGIGVTILITWSFSRYELKKGQETGSPSLVADARHIWTDMLSSFVILASLLGSAFGLAVDRYAALVVVLFIGRAGFGIAMDAVRVLLDASLDYESLNRIRKIVETDPRVVKINDLRARNAGRYKFVELDLNLRVKDLEKGHRVTEEIKGRIRKGLDNVDHVSIHYGPRCKMTLKVGVPLCEDRQTISEHFGEAPYFRLVSMFKEKPDGQDSILANPWVHEEKGKGIKVANWLLEQGLDIMIVRKDISEMGPGYVLGNAGVEIILVSETDANAAYSQVMAEMEKTFPDARLANDRQVQ
ncbi:MAG: cation diffusion facilitator family transporter [Deltaproteobacteria bacterium]|nr:cation diffusion facilitator family transporter [Deltaproteobacteria bacterium]